MKQKSQSDIWIAKGYHYPRFLNGQWVAIQSMLHTVAIVVGLDEGGYRYRYCYEYQQEAIWALMFWDGHGHPPGNWIKRKGEGGDLLNMKYLGEDDDNRDTE